MKCSFILLEDYVEDLLTIVERTELEDHLSGCKTCQQTLENLRTEQRLLSTTLNEQQRNNYTENLMEEIQQRNKIKGRRKRYQMMFIAVAILMISFTLIATTNKSSQHTDVPKDEESIMQNAAEKVNELQAYDIPLNEEPVLDIKIDSVIEKNGMKEITYRFNYNESIQRYSEATLNKLVSTYQIDELDLNLGWNALISILIRNSKNEVVTTFDMKESESIKPIYPLVSTYSQETEVLGEEITHFSLPIETDPRDFEIESYFVQLLTFTEPFIFKKDENTSFDYLGHTYTIYDTQLKDDGLNLSISVEGQPEFIPYGWQITADGKSQHNFTFHKVENNKTFLTVILPQMKIIPDEMKMLPYRGLLHEEFKSPVVLDLKDTVEK